MSLPNPLTTDFAHLATGPFATGIVAGGDAGYLEDGPFFVPDFSAVAASPRRTIFFGGGPAGAGAGARLGVTIRRDAVDAIVLVMGPPIARAGTERARIFLGTP